MNFNKAEKLLKKIKNYRNINDDNYKNLKDLSKWLFLELNRQEFNDKIRGNYGNDNKRAVGTKNKKYRKSVK